LEECGYEQRRLAEALKKARATKDCRTIDDDDDDPVVKTTYPGLFHQGERSIFTPI
jgi:hypothetical protein